MPPGNSSVDEVLGIIAMFAEMEASPAVQEGGEESGPGAPPPVIYRSTWAGGMGGPGGAAFQSVIDLGPGEWVVWGDDPTAPQQPVTLNVTGETPADLIEPDADITVTLVDFALSFEGALTTGSHVVRIENQGAQPHFVILFKAPDGLTTDQFGQIVVYDPSDPNATPPDVPYDESDFLPLLQTAEQSIGVVQWIPVTLETGTYAAACFFPTAGVGDPHAAHGMYTVFTVE